MAKMKLVVLLAVIVLVQAGEDDTADVIKKRMKLIGGIQHYARENAPPKAEQNSEPDDIKYKEPELNMSYTADTKFNPLGMGHLYYVTRLFLNLLEGDNKYPDDLKFANYTLESVEKNIPEWVQMYSGIVAVVFVGLLFAVLMPIVGLLFCCCRCAGRCGSRRKQEKQRDPCKRVMIATTLSGVAVIILFGVVCAFVTNEHLTNGTDRLIPNVKSALKDVTIYLQNTNKEIDYLLVENYNQLKNKLHVSVGNAGDVVKNQLAAASRAVALTNLTTIVQGMEVVKQDLASIQETTTKLQVSTASLNDDLDVLRQELINQLRSCINEPACRHLLQQHHITELRVAQNFSELPDITHTFATVSNLLGDNNSIDSIQKKVLDGQKNFDGIKYQISRAVQDSMFAINDKVEKIGKHLEKCKNDFANSLGQVQNSVYSLTGKYLDVADDYIKEYSPYRYYLGLGVSGALLLILLCLTSGLLCGICGKRPEEMYSEDSDCCNTIAGGKFLMFEELSILSELTHIQEAAEQLEKISADPHLLPPSSEQVIQDLKGSESFWSFQTPPSSPSSLGSRKSSMCSISSLNSSSSGSSKSHQSLNHYWQRSASQNGHFPARLSSVSSQDSGFRSQDTLFLKYTPGLQVSNMSEQSGNDNSSTPSTPHAGTDTTPAATATWPNLQETLQFERAASAIMKDRPHTISSAYERGHQRPSLTVCTFHAPEASLSQPASPVSAPIPVSSSSACTSPPALSNNSTPHISPQAIYSRPPIPQRCSSLERPSVPSKTSIPNCQIMKTDQTKTVLSKVQARLSAEANQPPMYVNMSELASMAASRAQEMAINLPPPPPELTEHLERTESNEKDGSTSESSLESSSGYGSQTTFPSEETQEADSSVDLFSFNFSSNCCTMPTRLSSQNSMKQQCSGLGPGNLRSNLLRKSSLSTQKPPPPIRRTASISTSSRQALLTSTESSGSLENLPPPPSFLLDGGAGAQENTQSSIKNAQSIFQGLQQRNSSPQVQTSNPATTTVRVAETVRTLTELKHTPASPNAVRRTMTITRSQSAERRDSVGSGLIAALSAKLTPTLSPRHSRRHSEDMIARNLSQGNRSPVMGRLMQKGMSVSPGQNFLESLNAKLALQQQQVQQNQMNPVHNAARVRQLFAGRTVPDPTVCHDSLMDQIKRGTSLKKTRTINDRSAPKIH